MLSFKGITLLSLVLSNKDIPNHFTHWSTFDVFKACARKFMSEDKGSQ